MIDNSEGDSTETHMDTRARTRAHVCTLVSQPKKKK